MSYIKILGSGKVGTKIIKELYLDHTVIAVDSDETKLQEIKKLTRIETEQADLTKKQDIDRILQQDDTDLIINALPGSIGYKILANTIDYGIDSINLSLFKQNPLELDQRAKDKGVTAIVDAGIAPGLNNLILGYHSQQMEVEKYKCYVGSLPYERNLPLQYKAPYSPLDVLKDYIQKAHYIEDNKKIVKDGLSDPEYIDIDDIGTLEAFNTVGIRTLMETMDIPNMTEKTLRYPGHRKLMKTLIELGFLSDTPVNINGKNIKPLELTSKLLFPKWQLKKGEAEFTVMLVIIEGKKEGNDKKVEYTLFQKDGEESTSNSLAQTAGSTCAAITELLLSNNKITEGIVPPEYLGYSKDNFIFVWQYLKDNEINIDKNEIVYREI